MRARPSAAAMLFSFALASSAAPLALAQVPARLSQPATPRAPEIDASRIDRLIAAKASTAVPAPRGGAPESGLSNDSCISAANVGDGTFSYDLADATNDWPGTCGDSGAAPDLWFRYTAPCFGAAFVSTCGFTAGDSVLTVLAECGGPQIVCLDDSCGVQTQVSFTTVGGEDYYVRVAGYGGEVHSGQISFTCASGGPPPNDNCANATLVSGSGPHPFSLLGATTDGQPDPACMAFGSGQIENDVWFRWTAPCAGSDNAVVSLCGVPGIDTRLAVYQDAACVGPIVGCNDDACGLQSRVAFSPVPATTYTVRVGTFPGATAGAGAFSVTCVAAPARVCTAFNQATDCQGSSFDAAYNVSSFSVAESINANALVTHVCIQGLYFNNVPVPDAWTLNIYSSNPSGYPGDLIESFTQGLDMSIAGPAPTGGVLVGRDVQEWSMALSRPVNHNGGCLWYEVSNVAAGDSVFWIDGNDSNGNHQSGGIGGALNPDDLAICVNGGFLSNALCLVEPCANPPSCIPCCDFTDDGFLNSQDFFEFLSALFLSAPAADFNGDSFVNSQDFFDFVACFFAPPVGCP